MFPITLSFELSSDMTSWDFVILLHAVLFHEDMWGSSSAIEGLHSAAKAAGSWATYSNNTVCMTYKETPH